MNYKDLQFLVMLDERGQLNVNPERRTVQFPGSGREWSRRMLRRLRVKGYIRPTFDDPNCFVITRLGQWRLDRFWIGGDNDAVA